MRASGCMDEGPGNPRPNTVIRDWLPGRKGVSNDEGGSAADYEWLEKLGGLAGRHLTTRHGVEWERAAHN